MTIPFTTEELAQLFAYALQNIWLGNPSRERHAQSAKDSGLLLRIAIKACISADRAVRDILPLTFQILKIPHRYCLRVWFTALARSGQLDELPSLLNHKSADVRIAIIEAFHHFGGRRIDALRDLGDDRAVSLLIRALESSPEPPRHRVSNALEAIGPRAGALLQEAFETNPIIRAHDGRLLARTAGIAALGALLEALSSLLRLGVKVLALGLEILGAPSIPSLLSLLVGSNRDIAVSALRILGSIGSLEASKRS